jgi:hypothetical protein
MAQPIQRMMPAAEITLRANEDMNINTSGYSRTAAPPGPQPGLTAGGLDKPGVTTAASLYQKGVQQQQNQLQNMQSRVPLAQSDAIQKSRLTNVADSQAQELAQRKKDELVTQMLYANDAGTATFALGNPEVADRVHASVAQAKQMAQSMNPVVPFTSNNLPG